MFKKIKTLTTMCPECEIEREVQYGTKDESVNIRKEKISVEAKVFYCPEGNHYFSDIEDDEEKTQFIYREYRKRKNLLQPEEIEQIREKYGLSQTAFSIFLGFGEKTIHRYETGAIPDDPHNSFMRLIKDTYNFQRHFNGVKNNLPPRLKQKIEKQLLELRRVETLTPSVYIVESDIFETTAITEPIVAQGVTGPFSHTLGSEVYIALSDAEVGTGCVSYPYISLGKPIFKKKDPLDKELAHAA